VGAVRGIPALALAGAPLRGVVLRPLAGAHRPSRHLYAAIRAGADRSPCLAPVLAVLCEVARAAERRRGRAAPRR
jgi:hypothetical protein